MNHKVLLADDSLTIQKVIKITLANQPYDITDVSSEEELFQQLSVVQPKLVFLDFNLSEKYTGYELTTKIKSILPTTKVLLLLGTFDTVDDGAMEKCGASDKIVKPFDSNKFIAICKQLIETFADDDLAFPDPITKSEPDEVNEEDQWTVSHSTEQKFTQPEAPVAASAPAQNALQKEMSDWGISVPGVINESSSSEEALDLPPVIGEVKSLQEQRNQTEGQKFPDSDDLDYPTIEELNAQDDKPSEPAPAATSKLISIDSFSNNVSDLELEGNYVPDESDVKSIENQIRDEVEEDLWQADEFEDLKKEVSAKIEEVKGNFQPSMNAFDESLFKPIDDQESIKWSDAEVKEEPAFKVPESQFFQSQINMDDLRVEMEEMVKKYVKEYLDEYFKQKTEKVAWEVIPDLAENLIRQELSKISSKILEDN